MRICAFLATLTGVLAVAQDALAMDWDCAGGIANSPWTLTEYNTYKTLWDGNDNRYIGYRMKTSNGQITWQQTSIPIEGGPAPVSFINSPSVNVRRQSATAIYSIVSHNIHIDTYNNTSLINCQQGSE